MGSGDQGEEGGMRGASEGGSQALQPRDQACDVSGAEVLGGEGRLCEARLAPLFYEQLDAVRSLLGVDPLEDRRAAWLAESLARIYNTAPCETVEELLRGRRVCIIAGGDCVELSFPRAGCILVAVDSATRILLEAGIHPDMVFTDLDGGWEPLRRASRSALMIVHAHGGNAWLLREALGDYPRASVTVQVPWEGRVWTSPGFTDGGRAVLTALLAGASEVLVTGWCPERRPHPASGKRLDEWKRVKLRVAIAEWRVALGLAEALGVRLRLIGGGVGE